MIISFQTTPHVMAKFTDDAQLSDKSSETIFRQRVNLKKKLIHLGYNLVDFDGSDDVGCDYFNVTKSQVENFTKLVNSSSSSVTLFTIN